MTGEQFAQQARAFRRRLRLRWFWRRAPQAGERLRAWLKQLPSAAGLLIEAGARPFSRSLTVNPEQPYTVVLGGSKVSDKLAVIGALLPKVNSMLIGGGMLFTFLVALGHKVAGEPP